MMKRINLKDNTINIVMYHYVRPIKKSKYPNIKGLELNEFYEQINFFKNKTNIISEDDLIEMIKINKIPKKPSIFLTFDDGYKDHFNYVFPHLVKNKIKGSFYAPQKVIENKYVLDVNKIHFILEKEPNSKKILSMIDQILIKKYNFSLEQIKINKINTFSRFDNKETILVKRLLQYYLPIKIRENIIQKLFENIVKKNIANFSKELYLNQNNIKEMSKFDMKFGIHGDYHLWWEYITPNEIINEIEKPIKFFNKLIKKNDKISICYPYGSYNQKVISLIKKRSDISFGLSTKVNYINKKNLKKDILNYPRFDANDFKK